MKKPGGQTGQSTRSVAKNATKYDPETLKKALLAPENSIRQLIPWLAEQVDSQVPGNQIKSGNCVIKDFRPAWQETQASLSIKDGDSGIVIRRFGGDEFAGGIVEFVADVLKISKAKAAKVLIQRAGLVEVSKLPRSKAHAPKTQITGEAKSRPSTTQFRPVTSEDLARATNGWIRITPETAASVPADIQRRGLWPAVSEGRLRAYTRTDLPTVGLQPGAWLFEIAGPDGQVYNLKARNGPPPSTDAEGYHRYRYLLSGYGTPAWCSANLQRAKAEIWVEGELNGVALAEVLQDENIAVQGLAGHGGSPHIAHLASHERELFVYVDPDEKGSDKARDRWMVLAKQYGQVYLLPEDIFPEGDACDTLGQVGPEILKTRLLTAIESVRSNPPTEVWVDDTHGYGIKKGRLVAYHKRRQGGAEWTDTEVLTEFSAYIESEITRDDGSGEIRRELEVTGYAPDGRSLRSSSNRIKPEELRTMNWAVVLWGNLAIVHAGNGKRERASVAIQLLSRARGIEQGIVYEHTGWRRTVPYGWIFITAGTVINAQGAVEGVEVSLPDRLRDYSLPLPPQGEGLIDAVRASLSLFELAPEYIAAPMLGATYRAPLGRLDTTIIFTGRTGRYKTSFIALGMAHFGARFNRHHLPEGWRSTQNALEVVAFKLQDVLLIIDDYKPDADPKSRSQTESKAAGIINAVADGVGKATLTASREFRPNIYPRGTVLMSAEDVPVGESVQARSLIVPVNEPLHGLHLEKRPFYNLAEMQAQEGIFAAAMAGFVQYIAQHHDDLVIGSLHYREHLKDHEGRFAGRHPRTGPACAELSYGWRVFLDFAMQVGAMTAEASSLYWNRVVDGLAQLAAQQGTYQEEQDPVQRTLNLINTLFIQGRIHVIDRKTGDVPQEFAEQLGWRRHVSADGDGVVQESYGHAGNSVLVGWSGSAGGRNWIYLMPDALYEQLQQVANRQAGGLLPQKGTLWARLRDQLEIQGLMRCDREKRGNQQIMRTTHKVSVFGQAKQQNVLTLAFPLGDLSLESGIGGKSGIEIQKSSTQTENSDVPLTPSPDQSSGISGISAEDSPEDEPPTTFKTLVI